MSLSFFRVSVVIALVLCVDKAQAQLPGTQVYRSYPSGRPLYGTPVQALPTPFSNGGSCVAWCIADITPCDPDYWKVADRRCNQNQNGIFP